MSSEIANRLSEQAMQLVSAFDGRVGRFQGRNDLLGILRTLDGPEADRFAREYFGEGEHSAVGVDGSMEYDERLQMMLFYSNATAYSCPFSVGERLSFDLERVARGPRLSASAAIPLWVEDTSNVLPEMAEVDLELEHSMERIPNSFMTLAELYLAVKAAADARIVFLDRPLSGTHSTLSRDVRLLLQRKGTKLARLGGSSEESTLLDIGLTLYLGAPFMALPGRKKFLPHRVIRELMGGELSKRELAGRLSVDDVQLERAVKSLKRFDSHHDGLLLESADGEALKVREEVGGYWERMVDVAMRYAGSVYDAGGAPLSVGDDEWLTVLDVNTIAFVMLMRLGQLSVEKRILLLGIAKDTTATDIARAVLPFAERKGFVRLSSPAPRLKNDRAFLSILSSMNHDLEIPWRTRGYDSAFSTILSVPSKDDGFISARKVVSREQLFVRGFFQSRSMGESGRVHSPVFLFDRLYDPREDAPSLQELEVLERAGKSAVQPYYEGDGRSRVSNLALRIIAMTDNPEVYEAFGHNQLLYLADKAVKAEMRQMKSSLRGVADLRLGSMPRRDEVYGIATPFRSQRTEAEGARMRAASRE